MKSVLISIQPQWCEKIASGEKTVEIRKNRPKLEMPFKCYIYETKGKYIGRTYHTEGIGKVIGEFVCNRIDEFSRRITTFENTRRGSFVPKEELAKTCLEVAAINDYLKGVPAYFWHISDLVIYGDPKELSEFTPYCRFMMDDMLQCDSRKVACTCQALDRNPWPDCSVNAVTCKRRMKRPPQSWCYVEEVPANG